MLPWLIVGAISICAISILIIVLAVIASPSVLVEFIGTGRSIAFDFCLYDSVFFSFLYLFVDVRTCLPQVLKRVV